MPVALKSLETRLGHAWRERHLLTQALTHRSHGAINNERLEYLGDGVLNCVVGLMLYQRFPDLPEGRLSRSRANLVNQESLHEIARDLDLGRYLRLGEGEMKSGGATRPSILADALESLFGAALLDGGFETAQAMIERLFGERINAINPTAQGKDAKTRLQEWLQSRHHGLPRYTLADTSGQAHAQTFHVECHIAALKITTMGQGCNRKTAEQVAAEVALAQLEGQGTKGKGQGKPGTGGIDATPRAEARSS
jgi:ribonuclease-3